MLKESFIEKVLEKASILEVLKQDGVSVIKKGRVFMACCPYHNERNPSFRVWPQENCFKCYTCGAKGNIITYLKDKNALSFEEAIIKLADMEGIPVEMVDPAEATKIRADRLERETLLRAVATVHKYFRQCYESDSQKAKAARKYAESRWGTSYCDLIEIGYAPDTKGLAEFCSREGIPKDTLIKLGYIKENEANHSEYELLRDRITIPIRSKSKQIIAFTARDMSGSSRAKYMNSGESQVFVKSDSLFGIDSACGEAIKENKMYLVEGAPDVMRLKSLEIYNVVAPLGAVWNEKQLEQIKKATTRICIIPDADAPKNTKEIHSDEETNYDESLAETINQPGYKAAIRTAILALTADAS